MITLLTGVPGSGKSYFAVNHVSRLKDHSKILHNIEGFKLGTSLESFTIDRNIKKIDVFRKSFHEKDDSLHGWTIIIDEAAELFPKSLKDTDIISFFDYHRHYGIDIFLITQDIKKVCYDITCLAENHYRAASSAANPVPGFLLYQQMVGGESVSRKFLLKKKSVFALYKSSKDNSSSTLNIGKIYVIIIFIVTISVGIAARNWFNSMKPKEKADNQKQTTSVPATTNKEPINSNKQNKNNFSSPIAKALGGKPYTISLIKDYSGTYYVIKGIIIKKEYFPWPVVKSRTGLQALLPDDVYQEVISYDQSLSEDIAKTTTNQGDLSPLTDKPATGSEREAGGSAGRSVKSHDS